MEIKNGSQEEYKKFQALSSDFTKAKSSLNGLKQEKLITTSEKDFIWKTMNDRFSYLEYQAGFVLCYEMSYIGMEISNKREDLEKTLCYTPKNSLKKVKLTLIPLIFHVKKYLMI